MEKVKIKHLRKHIRSLEREIFRQLKDGTSCCGVSLAQCHAILEIGDLEKTHIAELAGALKLDKSTLSRTIEGLVQSGLVSRQILPDDRRYMSVTLTEQGKCTCQSINALSDRFYDSVFSHIPEDLHDSVISNLETLARAMQDAREESDRMSGSDRDIQEGPNPHESV